MAVIIEKNYSSIDGVLFNKDKTRIIAYAKDKICPKYTIPNSVKTIGCYAFDGCVSLTNINIPDSVETIKYSAFNDCTGLKDISIPNSVTDISGAFSGCTGLTSVSIPE